MRKQKILAYTLLFSLTFIVFQITQSLGFRISLPFYQKEITCQLDNGETCAVACPTVDVNPRGFPFRNNKYDECQVDGQVAWITLLNYSIYFAIFYGAYKYISNQKKNRN